MNKLVILSAGHQPGLDPGAVSRGMREADATIRITDRVAVLLKTWGMPYVYMPNTVGNLGKEIQWVNDRYKRVTDALAIQIHLNAGGGTGTETWIPSYSDKESQKQGKAINDALVASLKLKNRGVKFAHNHHLGGLGWVDNTLTYAVLPEVYFIDVDPITRTQEDKAAYGIAVGICNYFGVKVGKTPEEIKAAEAAAKALAAAKSKAEQEAKLASEKAQEALKQAEIARLAEEARLKAEQEVKITEAKLKEMTDQITETNTIAKKILSLVEWLVSTIKSIFNRS